MVRASAVADVAGSSGAAGSFPGSFGGSTFGATAATLIGLVAATLGVLL